MSGWKRGVCVCLCAALLTGLWGCGGRELYERLLIHGIGVDVKGNGFTITVRSSVSPEAEGEEFFRCEGESVLEALNSLTLSTGRKPFYAHNYLVVFGRECAERGLDRCLDFFIRYYSTRPAVQMYLAEGKAEEVLSFQKDGKYLKMSELQQLGDSSRENGRAVSVELLDLVNGVKREGSSPVLPVLRAGESGVEIVATGYFDGYALKGFLSPEETRGFLAVKDRLRAGEAVVRSEKIGTATLSLSKCRGKVTAERTQTQKFLVQVRAEGDVSALSGGRDSVEQDLYDEMEQVLSDALREEIEAAIQKAVLTDRCDIFGFGDLLYRTDPQTWMVHREDWKEQMTRCQYEVEVTARIKRLEQERVT